MSSIFSSPICCFLMPQVAYQQQRAARSPCRIRPQLCLQCTRIGSCDRANTSELHVLHNRLGHSRAAGNHCCHDLRLTLACSKHQRRSGVVGSICRSNYSACIWIRPSTHKVSHQQRLLQMVWVSSAGSHSPGVGSVTHWLMREERGDTAAKGREQLYQCRAVKPLRSLSCTFAPAARSSCTATRQQPAAAHMSGVSLASQALASASAPEASSSCIVCLKVEGRKGIALGLHRIRLLTVTRSNTNRYRFSGKRLLWRLPQCSGVLLLSSRALTLAPALRRSQTTSVLALEAAQCNGVDSLFVCNKCEVDGAAVR